MKKLKHIKKFNESEELVELTDCLCIKCFSKYGFKSQPSSIRFACEICGNKRCPHHSDHTLKCTNSNEVNQEGSIY